jgi:hypothetical protein
MVKRILKSSVMRRSSDLLLSPLTLISALWYKYVRTGKASSMPVTEKIFMRVGVLPISNHYYQPLINPSKELKKPLSRDRNLPGINFNLNEQLDLLNQLNYSAELSNIPLWRTDAEKLQFFFENDSFLQGDASYYYNVLRHFKPGKIIEVGCGYSTLLAMEAHRENKRENASYCCKHICIEPYEMPWLDQLKVEIHRKKVEDIESSYFTQLERNDILFIDSSHIIRPQGDVLFEILEILPLLKSGTLIHFHDIFTPRDYLVDWVMDQHLFWNEQYLLEAFLSFNKEFRIMGALNYLKHNHRSLFHVKFPASANVPADEPGSFWIVKN